MILLRLSVIPASLIAGGIALFSFLVAPTILGNFESNVAGPVMRALFPVYYPGLGAVALVGIALYLITSARLAALLMICILGGFLYQYLHILDVMENLRAIFEDPAQATDKITAARSDWGRWHGISMGINMTQLLLSLILVWLGASKTR